MYETMYADMMANKLQDENVTSGAGVEKLISISKEQTPEEIERMKLFSEEVVEVMKRTPNFSMYLNHFLYWYYHHFGKRCCVSYYGFSELSELFEAIPSVIEVKGTGKFKIICLVNSLKYKILTGRLIAIIKLQPNEMVELTQLNSSYFRNYGCQLRFSHFGCKTIRELAKRLKNSIKIIKNSQGYYLYLIHRDGFLRQISLNIRSILMEQSDGAMLIPNACNLYQKRFGLTENLVSYFKEMPDVIKIMHGYLQLTPLQLLAKFLITLLQENSSRIPLSLLEDVFKKRFGVPLSPANYQFETLESLLKHLSDYFKLKGKGKECLVLLRSSAAAFPSAAVKSSPSSVSSLKEKQNIRDILNEHVPSRLPLPIKPCVKEKLDESMDSKTSLIADFSHIPESFFEFESPIKNATASVPNVIKTSITPAKVKSTETLSQKCPTTAAVTHSVSDLEISANLSVHLPQNSSNKYQGATTDFCQNIEKPVSIPNNKNPVSQMPKDFTEYNNGSHCATDDITSSNNTSTSNGRYRRRRSRIAAVFSASMIG